MSLFYEALPDTKNYHLIRNKADPHAQLHFHAAFEFLIVRKGKMLAQINHEQLILSEAEGCFVDAFYPHSFEALEKDTEIFVFVGNAELFSAAFGDIGGTPARRFSWTDFDFLYYVTDLYHKAASSAVQLAVFRGAISLLAAQIPINIKPRADSGAETISAILGYINERFTEPITLADIARQFGYSPQYLSRLFHRFIPMNITDYVNVARVNYAEKLLCEKKTVAQVAFESGFNSMPSFYRAYKKHTGVLPKR